MTNPSDETAEVPPAAPSSPSGAVPPESPAPPPRAIPAPAPPPYVQAQADPAFAPVLRQPWVNPARRTQALVIALVAAVLLLGAGFVLGAVAAHHRTDSRLRPAFERGMFRPYGGPNDQRNGYPAGPGWGVPPRAKQPPGMPGPQGTPATPGTPSPSKTG